MMTAVTYKAIMMIYGVPATTGDMIAKEAAQDAARQFNESHILEKYVLIEGSDRQGAVALVDIHLIIFDCDGTLVEPQISYKFNTGKRKAEQWQFLPGVVQRCAQLLARGVKLGIATNQGGVAFNYCTEEQIWPELLSVGAMLGIDKEAIKVCYMHPKGFRSAYKGESEDRKPAPGMLLKLMEQYQVAPEHTLYVGDMESDEQAARNAGCHYMDAKLFWSLPLQVTKVIDALALHEVSQMPDGSYEIGGEITESHME